MALPAHVEADTLVGRLLLPADDPVVTPAIQQDGTWEPGESAALTALIKPGAVIVEVGAHVGYLTALMAHAAGPEGRLLAIEAHPGNYALLAENMRRLGLNNVHAVHGAAWRDNGSLELAVSPDNSGDHRAYAHAGSTQSVSVPSIRLDTMLEPDLRVDVIKVDAQGVDHIALEGLARTLTHWHPTVLVEFWPLGIRELGADPEAVVRSYRALGYDVSVLERPTLRPGASEHEIVNAAESCPGEYCSLLLRAPAPVAPTATTRNGSSEASPVDAARDVLARGPEPSPGRSASVPRDFARQALLRALRPFTAYERQVDEQLVAGLAATDDRVAALEAELARLGGAQPAAAEQPAEGYTLQIEYAPSATNTPRWGWGSPAHPQLAALFASQSDAFDASMQVIAGFVEELTEIPIESSDVLEPNWFNPSLPALDGAAIYGFLRERKPRRYFEVGSGNSTKFAARAKRDGNLETELISIDPAPWTEVDPLCDRTVRKPFELVDPAVLAEIEPGDILFFDASHRTFMNGDTVTFFLETIPSLPPGVLVAVHDIFLPDDYPRDWAERWYNEQYLLACWLLAGGERMAPVLASYYVSFHTELDRCLERLWSVPGFDRVPRHGGAFWFETRGAPAAGE